MRDSQSLFDQLLAFGEERITAEDVHRLLGTASDERLINLAEALIARRRDAVLGQFDAALGSGVQLGELVDQFLNYLRDLMVLASGAEGVPLLAVSLSHRERLKAQADQWGLQTILAALQILAEAKGQMFRASSARALAEVALVRISLLEDLQALDRLVQELKQGRSPVAGSASPLRPPAAVSPAPARVPASEKKKLNGAASPPRGEAPSNGERLDLQPGREREFWAQVQDRVENALKAHVQAVADIAIFGPNHLELSFSKRYHFSKQYCERPEIRSRLENLAAQVAGRPIRLTFSLVEGEESPPAAGEPEADDQPLAVGPENDPFIAQVMEVFGGTVVKVERITAPAGREETA